MLIVFSSVTCVMFEKYPSFIWDVVLSYVVSWHYWIQQEIFAAKSDTVMVIAHFSSHAF